MATQKVSEKIRVFSFINDSFKLRDTILFRDDIIVLKEKSLHLRHVSEIRLGRLIPHHFKVTYLNYHNDEFSFHIFTKNSADKNDLIKIIEDTGLFKKRKERIVVPILLYTLLTLLSVLSIWLYSLEIDTTKLFVTTLSSKLPGFVDFLISILSKFKGTAIFLFVTTGFIGVFQIFLIIKFQSRKRIFEKKKTH